MYIDKIFSKTELHIKHLYKVSCKPFDETSFGSEAIKILKNKGYDVYLDSEKDSSYNTSEYIVDGKKNINVLKVSYETYSLDTERHRIYPFSSVEAVIEEFKKSFSDKDSLYNQKIQAEKEETLLNML